MSMLLMAKAFGVNVGNASRKLVLLKLADNANDQGECWPSYQHIADQCEISKRSAMDHIKSLCDMGLVLKRARKGVKGNSTNVYILNLRGEKSAPPSANDSLPPSAESAPRTSHSSEPVNEPVLNGASDDAPKANAYPEDFENAWSEYPAREGSNPKNHAYHAWKARLADGVSSEEMLAGLRRYVMFCQSKGSVGTSFVMQAKRFFGPSHEFENAWTVSHTPPDKYGRTGFAQPKAQGTYTPNDETLPAWMEN